MHFSAILCLTGHYVIIKSLICKRFTPCWDASIRQDEWLWAKAMRCASAVMRSSLSVSTACCRSPRDPLFTVHHVCVCFCLEKLCGTHHIRAPLLPLIIPLLCLLNRPWTNGHSFLSSIQISRPMQVNHGKRTRGQYCAKHTSFSKKQFGEINFQEEMFMQFK